MVSLAFAALWVFVFSIPWERMIVLPGVSIVAKATGALAFGLALLAVVVSGRFRRLHAFHVAALLFVMWTAVVQWISSNGGKLPNKFWTWPQLLVMVWMIWELAPSIKHQRRLLLAYVLGASIAAADTILMFRSRGASLQRFAAGGGDPNDLAMLLALGLPMAWYLASIYRRPALQWLCRGYLPLALLAIGLTGSRGGMVVTTVALLVIPLTMTDLAPGKLAAALAMVAVAGTLAVVYVPETLIERLATTGTELQGGHLGGRGKLWVAGFRAFEQRPLMGFGNSAFRAAITPFVGNNAQVAHNSFISVLVEQGLVGLILFLTFIFAVVPGLLRLPRLERRFALVLLATLLLAMMPLTWEDRRAVWFVLPALLGLAKAWPAGPSAAARGSLAEPRAATGRAAAGRRVGSAAVHGSPALRNAAE
ncbi:MAG TPA: O-antigen ligase family protein [Gemmatimonadales bacterium]